MKHKLGVTMIANFAQSYTDLNQIVVHCLHWHGYLLYAVDNQKSQLNSSSHIHSSNHLRQLRCMP